MRVSTARESETCYWLGTSVGDVTRLNVANVLRFAFLYIADIEIFDCRYFKLTGSRSNSTNIITKNTSTLYLKTRPLKRDFRYLEYSCKYF